MRATTRLLLFLGAVSALVASAGQEAGASTFVDMKFSDIVQRAEMVALGTVTSLRTVSRGEATEDETSQSDENQPPRDDGSAADGPSADAPEADTARSPRVLAETATPQALATEGGRMLFTEVTFEVERSVLGEAPRTLTFLIAGGSDGETEVIVHGLPTFELGARYLLFIDPSFRDTANPIVGANQGFFRVAEGPAGKERLITYNGDVVVSIDDQQITVQYDPEFNRRVLPQLADGPTPDDARSTRTNAISPALARYWMAEDTPLSVDAFIAATLSAEEAAQ